MFRRPEKIRRKLLGESRATEDFAQRLVMMNVEVGRGKRALHVQSLSGLCAEKAPKPVF